MDYFAAKAPLVFRYVLISVLETLMQNRPRVRQFGANHEGQLLWHKHNRKGPDVLLLTISS